MMNPTTAAELAHQNPVMAPAPEAEQPTETVEAAQPAGDVVPYVNSVDATMGQPLVARVMTRKHELEAALETWPAEDTRGRGDLELALSTVGELLTGDLSRVPEVVAADLNQWLERNKHLAERATEPSQPVEPAEPVAMPVDAEQSPEPGADNDTSPSPSALTDTDVPLVSP